MHPTARQTVALVRQLNYQRELYNAALEERVESWKWERRSVSFFDECRTLTAHADVNAVRNILRAGRARQASSA